MSNDQTAASCGNVDTNDQQDATTEPNAAIVEQLEQILGGEAPNTDLDAPTTALAADDQPVIDDNAANEDEVGTDEGADEGAILGGDAGVATEDDADADLGGDCAG